ncbi:hypothetical protein SEA_SCENTAE_115 [Gordonia phage SCentae]|nr:hypothetical protein SEA_SCENTAE_115 [Gordonia phage SCentae]
MGMPIARQSEQYNVHQAEHRLPPEAAVYDDVSHREAAAIEYRGRSVQAGYNNPRAHRREALDFPGLDTLKGLNPFGGDDGGEKKGTGLEGFPSLNDKGDKPGESESDTEADLGGDYDDGDLGGLINDEGLGGLKSYFPGSDFGGSSLPGSSKPKDTGGGPNIQYV